MSLISRISLTGPETSDPEDLLSDSLGVVFPDDVTNQHGDSHHGLLYTSPYLPNPIQLALAQVENDSDRRLFSHYLWNSSLLLAELIEAGTLGLSLPQPSEELMGSEANDGSSIEATSTDDQDLKKLKRRHLGPPVSLFDITGLSTIELGAGTALPSIMAGLIGARRVVITDYPSKPVLKTLQENVKGAIQAKNAPSGRFAVDPETTDVLVAGHAWGEFDTPLAKENWHAFDRVISADCLWMPWQHENLRRSIEWFLNEDENARAWVVAGFHTGRQKMRGFFDKEALAAVGLEVEYLWERDCNGMDRPWAWDRGIESISVRKRWLAIGVLKRIRKSTENGGQENRSQ